MKLMELFDRKFAVALLLILGALLAISPAGLQTASRYSPREVATSITSRSDHVTAEDVSSWIIDKRPDLLVVDIRSSEEYNRYHIPGAVNIPLSKLFDDESMDILKNAYTIVLYSNGDSHAAQAWVILRELGIDSYVMLGGLNYWAKAILNPEPPGDLAADPEILQYQFRSAASGYFNNGGIAVEKDEKKEEKPLPKKILRPIKRKTTQEGC